MTRNEFIEKIDRGCDILLHVAGKDVGIFTWCDEGIGIDESHPNEKGMQYFPTAEALVEGYLVDGVPLGDLVENIVITDYT